MAVTSCPTTPARVDSNWLMLVSRPVRDVANQTPAAGGGPHARVHHVVHEDEVARLLPVAVDRHRRIAHDLFGERGDDAALPSWVLARSVDGTEGQGAELDGMELAIDGQVVDDGLLGHAVGRARLVRMGLTDGQVLGIGLPVQRRTARREDHPLRLGLAGALEDVEGPDDVDRGIEGRALHRGHDVWLGSQVKDQAGPATHHELDHRGDRNVEMVDGQGTPGAAAGIGQVRERPGREVVDDVDLISLDEEPVHQVRPDETRSSCHERAHARVFLPCDALAVDHRSGRDHGVGTEDRHRTNIGALPDDGPRTHDGARHLGVGGHVAAIHHDAVTDDRSR